MRTHEKVVPFLILVPMRQALRKVGKYLTQFLNDRRAIDINFMGRFYL